MNGGHVTVLRDAAVDLLAVRPGGRYIDGTVGGGGHALAILERCGADGFLLGIDKDPEALERARARLDAAGCAGRYRLAHGDFGDIAELARREGVAGVSGVLFDLGVSSPQLDTPERGFSFDHDGPLDMRMDPTAAVTAEMLVNALPEAELAGLLRAYGEEPQARRIAGVLVRARTQARFTRTRQLAAAIERAVGGRRGARHPATRTFQALRIAVNGELDSLARGLAGGLDVLVAGGRLAVIAFHSLEDRLVKQFLSGHAGREESLQAGGSRWRGQMPRVRLLTRKPLTAGADECGENPRARSAKLRAAERLPDAGGDADK